MQKGLTLIEVIVSIAITGILIAILTLMVSTSGKEYALGKNSLESASVARVLQMEIENSIKEATYATCFFNHLGLYSLGPEYKGLIYIVPLKPGTSPYLLALRHNDSGEVILLRLYLSNRITSKVSISTWRQQGFSMVPAASMSFEALTDEEEALLNSQINDRIYSKMSSGLTELSSSPAVDASINGAQKYFQNASSGEYSAFVSFEGIKYIAYLEKIKYYRYDAMDFGTENIVMDGIKDINIFQEEKGRFLISIQCGDDTYISYAIMRSYTRGVRLEKK